MKEILAVIIAVAISLAISGCGTTGKAITQSASGKNLDLNGFMMLGEIETANPETMTPQGKMITGRFAYKSRRVAIPADQKVPTTGNFKATKTKSFFGTEETIIEYDFTAGSDKDAKVALDEMTRRSEAAQQAFEAKTESKK